MAQPFSTSMNARLKNSDEIFIYSVIEKSNIFYMSEKYQSSNNTHVLSMRNSITKFVGTFKVQLYICTLYIHKLRK